MLFLCLYINNQSCVLFSLISCKFNAKNQSLMWDAEASRSRICLLLENKKQNTFASENNLESIRVP